MMTCTTIVLLILVDVTRPILVLRLPVFFAIVVSAIYFFLFLAAAVAFFFAVLAFTAGFAFFFFLALLPAAADLGLASASPAASALWPLLGASIPSSFSRIT